MIPTRCDSKHGPPHCPDPDCHLRRALIEDRRARLEAEGYTLWIGNSGITTDRFAWHCWIGEEGGYHSHSTAKSEQLAIILTYSSWVANLRLFAKGVMMPVPREQQAALPVREVMQNALEAKPPEDEQQPEPGLTDEPSAGEEPPPEMPW